MNRHEREARESDEDSLEGSAAAPAAVRPDDPVLFYQDAMRLLKAGQLVEAGKCGRQALAIDGGHADTLHLMGMLCFASGQLDLAIEWFAQAIRRNPNVSDYFFNLAAALQNQGRVDDAIKSYDRGLTLNPKIALGWFQLGELLLLQGRRQEAELSFDQALKVKPDYLEAVNSIALLNFQDEKYDAAISRFEQSLAIKPEPGAMHLKGICHLRLKRFEQAEADIARALDLVPDHPEVTGNYGLALLKLGRHEEALRYFDKALSLKPDLPNPLNHRATSLQALHRFDEAIADLERAIAIDPEFADAHWNLALLRLLLGDFERGWAQREWGRKSQLVGFVDRQFRKPLWLGEGAIAGKTILLHSDEGLGDTIQFSRYAPLVAAHGARVILEVQDTLQPLLSGMDGIAVCLPKTGSELPPFDLHCPLSSLPLAFETRLETIPANFPYLPPPPDHMVADWQARLGSDDKLRIGLVWSGNPIHGNDRNRSMPLRMLAPILELDARFISLQKEPRPEDRLILRERNEVLDLTEQLTDFAHTAALISCLDLVIAVDTSVAHLSAALMRPTWIMLPHTPDYRWLLHRDDSAWYPTVRLFRQSVPSEYASVVDRIRRELQVLLDEFGKEN